MLKPCPFCGSNNLHKGYQSAFTFGVSCVDCHAIGPTFCYPGETELEMDELDRDLLEKAITAWNNRNVQRT